MNLDKRYISAIKKHDYNELIKILLENLIVNFNYKSINDLGIYLIDIDHKGICLKFSEEDCFKFGSLLIRHSYYNFPDIFNALSLQFLCLEKENNYKEVINMQNTAIKLNNPFIINNIAYANYKLGNILEALDYQKYAIDISKNNTVILEYNLMLYELMNNYNIINKYDCKKFIDMLTGDEIFDYERAIMLAIYFDYYDYVVENLEFLKEMFCFSEKVKVFISNYIDNGRIISSKELLSILSPETLYENSIYINRTSNATQGNDSSV